MKQKTIKNITSISGVGLHTGLQSTVTLMPAKSNTGINFIRTDLNNNPIIKANLDNVISTNRSTCLKKNQAEVKTVEHLLAAIAGADLDNLIIQINNLEVPILDGSSKDFTQIINDAGVSFNLDKANKLSICWSLYSGFHL